MISQLSHTSRIVVLLFHFTEHRWWFFKSVFGNLWGRFVIYSSQHHQRTNFYFEDYFGFDRSIVICFEHRIWTKLRITESFIHLIKPLSLTISIVFFPFIYYSGTLQVLKPFNVFSIRTNWSELKDICTGLLLNWKRPLTDLVYP